MDVHFSSDSRFFIYFYNLIFILLFIFIFIFSHLYTCSTDTTVRIWDMETGICLRKLKSHTDFVNSCHPARRGPELICSGSDDGTIIV